MQLNELKPKHYKKGKKRVGRGGKKGTFSGRGSKGQKARAGRQFEPAIRGLIKKYPKLKGYRREVIAKKIAVVNLGIVEKNFAESEVINAESLLKKGLIRRIKGRLPKIKVLGKEEIKKVLSFENCLFSKSAREKVEKAGGRMK